MTPRTLEGRGGPLLLALVPALAVALGIASGPGCAPPEPAVPAGPPVPTASGGAPAAGHDHPAAAPADHGHGALHGGMQLEVGGQHVEALAMPTGVLFWVSDADARPIPADAFTGTATIQGPSGVQTVPLVSMGDHLHALVKLEQGSPATVVVTLNRDGKALSASYEVAAVGLASHDHTSLHGGQVGMWGETHVEYLGANGEYRFWISDERRVAVTDGVSGTVTDAGKATPLAFDSGQGLASARGEGAGTRPVTVELRVGAQAFSLAFNPSGEAR